MLSEIRYTYDFWKSAYLASFYNEHIAIRLSEWLFFYM